ncbi:thioredoxin family protein [Halovenus sp. HT40]|uniref:thioredoxin family protein n=1 Tax=Halovenus sp. HT40 TaxID=3126691 RepID=UPI00300E8E2D
MVALDSKDVLEPGDVAPDFELKGTDGESYSLADFSEYEGLLVVFTCNHCPYAKAKFEEMNRLAEEYDEIAVVGINPNDETEYPADDFETMVERVEDGTIQWDTYLRDDEQTVAAEYGAVCTPDPFLFANREDDTFRLAYHGRLDDAMNPDDEPDEREMRNHIEDLLASKPMSDDFKASRGCSIKWREGNEPDYWDA